MEEITVNNDLADRWHSMLFGVRRSIRYHKRRRAFFDRLDQFSTMLTVILGSTAIYGILKSTETENLALFASGLVTVLASINLVIGSTRRAREHDDFARRFIALEKKMLGTESEELLHEVSEARLSIEAEEPPVMRILNCMCHNEQMRAMGYKKDELATIGPLQKLFAHFFDWRDGTIH